MNHMLIARALFQWMLSALPFVSELDHMHESIDHDYPTLFNPLLRERSTLGTLPAESEYHCTARIGSDGSIWMI